jgi:hypothetical protein
LLLIFLALLFRTLKVLGLIVDPVAEYPEVSNGFSQYLQANAGITSSNRPQSLPSRSSQLAIPPI